MRYLIRAYFGVLTSSLLGFVFILAAISKLVDMPHFQNTVQDLHYLPLWARTIAILWLPGLELVVGLCLLCRTGTREAALIAGCLMVIFLWVSVHAAIINPHAGCGCFKIAVPALFNLTGWGIVGRDFLLVLGCQYLVMHKHNNLPSRAGAEIDKSTKQPTTMKANLI